MGKIITSDTVSEGGIAVCSHVKIIQTAPKTTKNRQTWTNLDTPERAASQQNSQNSEI